MEGTGQQKPSIRTAKGAGGVMADDFLHYDRLVEDAMRGVVRSALGAVAERGLPGLHHFYVTFATRHPAVVLPARLAAQYPETMTIVLQHQYFGLEVHSTHFEVTLSFNRVQERLHVPWEAVTVFHDPSVDFGLRFSPQGAEPLLTADGQDGDGEAAAEAEDAGGKDGNVVSLDRFRKK